MHLSKVEFLHEVSWVKFVAFFIGFFLQNTAILCKKTTCEISFFSFSACRTSFALATVGYLIIKKLLTMKKL